MSFDQAATRNKTFIHTDAVEAADLAVHHLREKERCEVVVVLTHMDQVEDERLAREVVGLDLVLGGHNHGYSAKRVGSQGVWVVKSGTEFRHLSVIKLTFSTSISMQFKLNNVEVGKKDVTSSVPAASGWEDDGLVCGQMMRLLPKYAAWAIAYHGYKRIAKLKRICC